MKSLTFWKFDEETFLKEPTIPSRDPRFVHPMPSRITKAQMLSLIELSLDFSLLQQKVSKDGQLEGRYISL